MRRRAFLTAPAVPLLAAPSGPLPTIALGRTRVSRLIAGSNPVNGIAHSTKRMDELMNGYFTVERTTEFLLNCERNGINTWQSSYWPKVREALAAARGRGSKLQFICLTSGRQYESFKDILAMKPIALVHHGGVTDSLFHSGKRDAVRDFLKRAHDTGVMAGMSTHNPDHLAFAEDAGWETDFYMTCFYHVTRTPEQIRAMVSDRVLGELFLAGDPDRMTARVRQVKKPCLGFKILAAGRLCGNAKQVEQAFAFAYRNLKPTDGVIVGMFPVLFDEVAINAALARKYGV